MEPGLKLVITLRFLATGNSYQSLEFSFRVAHNTISVLVPEVCTAIFEEYKDEHFTLPQDQDEWRQVAAKFSDKWNFQHCLGAIDGKHIEMKKPKKSGSLYYNYKGYFSIVLLAVADADYKFIWCSVGAPGSASDAGVFNGTRLRPALEEGRLPLPDPDPLTRDDQETPYFLIGDDAFPLRTWLMKPYGGKDITHMQRVFNYRLSRARRVVENAFGILANRWRCLLTCLQLQPRNVNKVVKGTLTLHNWLRTRNPGLRANDVDREDGDGNLVPGAWRENVQLTYTQHGGAGRPNFEGKRQRNYLSDYYNSDVGRLPWQDRIVNM